MTLRFAAAALLFGLAGPVSAQVVTIDTATGPVEVPSKPESVVALDIAAIDTLEALQVPVAGVPAPIYVDYLQDVFDGAEHVGTLFEPDFEKLAILGPDLIIAGGRSAAQVEALSAVAPTVDMTLWGGDLLGEARNRIAAYGLLFDKTDAAETLLATLDAKVVTAQAAVAGKGKALILLTNGGKLAAYGADSRFGWVHSALDLPEAHPGLSAETHGESVSFEFIAEVNPDWLLVIDRGAAIGQEGEAAQATLDNPLVAGTTAAQNGHIVYLDGGPIYLAGGGYQAMNKTLDEIIAAFGGSDR